MGRRRWVYKYNKLFHPKKRGVIVSSFVMVFVTQRPTVLSERVGVDADANVSALRFCEM